MPPRRKPKSKSRSRSRSRRRSHGKRKSYTPKKGKKFYVRASYAKKRQGSCRGRKSVPNCYSNPNCYWIGKACKSRGRKSKNLMYGPSLPVGMY